MPIEKIVIDQDRAWAIWKTTETEDELFNRLSYQEQIPESITHPQKRLEWFAARLVTGMLVEAMGLKYAGMIKDEFGKPYLKGLTVQLSLSHSYPYVAAIIDGKESVGIDLEQPKQKLLKIAHRVLHADEAANAGPDEVKHCIYWCAKEALIKIHGKKDLVFAKNLLINPFTLESEGHIIGNIIVDDRRTVVPLYYAVSKNFVIVFNHRT